VPAGLKNLLLNFDADIQFLKGKNASGVFKALDEVLLKGLKFPELSWSSFTMRCSENIKNTNLQQFGVRRAMLYIIHINICHAGNSFL